MGKLKEKLATHKFARAEFTIDGEAIPLLVKILPEKEYAAAISLWQNAAVENDRCRAELLASLFVEPDQPGEPAFTADDILSDTFTRADVGRLINLFVKVNNGIEGN